MQNIIQLLQGVVVSSIEEFKEEKECVCIIISELVDTEDYTQYESEKFFYFGPLFCLRAGNNSINFENILFFRVAYVLQNNNSRYQLA